MATVPPAALPSLGPPAELGRRARNLRVMRFAIGRQFPADQWEVSACSDGRPPSAPSCRWREERRSTPVGPARPGPAMPHYQAWEEFTRAAEKLYLADPMKVGWEPGREAGRAGGTEKLPPPAVGPGRSGCGVRRWAPCGGGFGAFAPCPVALRGGRRSSETRRVALAGARRGVSQGR